MKSMQRKIGGMKKRSADVADVGAVLAEFKAMDEMLDRLIKDLKSWRDGWESVLKLQYDTSEAFATLYRPIEPTQDPIMTRTPTETPQRYMQKCLGLQKLYSDVKEDLGQEIAMIDNKLLRPAQEAKACTKSLHKTLKHRENTKLDYERYLSKAESARKKEAKSLKDEAALVKCEGDLAQAQIDYQTADDQIKQTFPPVTDAVISLIPHLLASQVMLQTTLVGQLYTVLDTYCKRQGLPTPAPGDDEIIQAWDQDFTGFRKELEGGITVLMNGKAINMAMTLPEKKSTVTGLGIRNKVMKRGNSSQAIPQHKPSIGSIQSSTQRTEAGEEEELAPPKPPRPGSVSPSPYPTTGMGMAMPSPGIPLASKPRNPNSGSSNVAPYDQKPTALSPSWPNPTPPSYDQASGSATPPSRYQTPLNGVPTPLSSGISSTGKDYFSGASSNLASSIAAKKKPPPPVPTKRIPSSSHVQYVTALYDFEGQNHGDLTFREGDKIRVVKKTESSDDWWDGELRGQVGCFPANYVSASQWIDGTRV